MKNPNRRTIRSGVLALLLLGAMFAGLNNSGTFTKLAFAQNYGGSGSCPAPAGCGNWGCYYQNGVLQCTLYNIGGGQQCSGTRTCTKAP